MKNVIAKWKYHFVCLKVLMKSSPKKIWEGNYEMLRIRRVHNCKLPFSLPLTLAEVANCRQSRCTHSYVPARCLLNWSVKSRIECERHVYFSVEFPAILLSYVLHSLICLLFFVVFFVLPFCECVRMCGYVCFLFSEQTKRHSALRLC